MSDPAITFLLWSDLGGITRTRGVPTAAFENRVAHGLGWACAGQAVTPLGDLIDNPWGPCEEVRQRPDPDTLFTIRGDEFDLPDLNGVICDSGLDSGEGWSCCPRSSLRRSLEKLETETGLKLYASFEHEFLVSGDNFRPDPGFTFAAALNQSALLTAIHDALLVANITPYTIEPEYGTGQYEVAVEPDIGVRAADVCLITREIIREITRRHGLSASFSPKPSEAAMGNGSHVHLSLVDADGNNQIYDEGGTLQLSELGAQFAAGIWHHLDALVAFAAPSPVSYYRLGPHHWSCGYRTIGFQNREAALRIIPGMGNEKQRRQGCNIEFRPCDGTSSPYLTLAALVEAGLSGIRQRMALPEPITCDPDDMDEGARAAIGATPLATSLLGALQAFRADEAAQDWFAPDLARLYTDIKTRELEAAEGVPPADLMRQYRAIY